MIDGMELSGVAADDIRMLGKLFGNRDLKITSLWCMGMNQHIRGTAINTMVHGIHLLSGHFGRPADQEVDALAVLVHGGSLARVRRQFPCSLRRAA